MPRASGPRASFGVALATACLTGTLLLGSIAEGRAERNRPPPAYTGAFGEPDCTVCHASAPLNAGTGTITIAGIPAEYEAGSVHVVTITLAQHGLAAAGFQLSARFRDGTQAGTLAGCADEVLRSAVTTQQAHALAGCAGDTLRVAATTRAEVQYIHHVYEGTTPVAPDTARWTVLWAAPDSGAVQLDLAANAADDDFSPLGDFIYTTSVRTVHRVPKR